MIPPGNMTLVWKSFIQINPKVAECQALEFRVTTLYSNLVSDRELHKILQTFRWEK